MPESRNRKPDRMEYRRFGKTELELSVITLGGMRYKNSWGEPRDQFPRETLDQALECTRLAFEHGINHIETAHGYGKSEHIYGKVLAEELNVPRDRYFLMTKGGPMTAEDTRAMVEKQLKALRTDRIDLYGWHGVNSRERYQAACASGGPVEELLKLKEEGVIGTVGFSTHGTIDVILDTVNTGLFDFMNVHYYYFLQRNRPAVEECARRDMGVFIISPNDKGGQLFHAPEILKKTTAPLTPIQWNARFCLSTPMVQTLSFGMTEPAHFAEMAGIVEKGRVPWGEREKHILEQMNARRELDPHGAYEGLDADPGESGINIPEILRFRRMWKCYDMETFGFYRYNMFQPNDTWFSGTFPSEENLAKMPEQALPDGTSLKQLLRETHEKFYRPKKK